MQGFTRNSAAAWRHGRALKEFESSLLFDIGRTQLD